MNLPGAARLQRIEFLTAIVFTIALVALHVLFLTSAGPLWRDEISSLTLATRPSWGELWRTLVYDPFPALFFTTLRAWHTLFGGSDFVLRFFGFVIGLLCIAGFWVSARWTKRRTPLLALALFGFSPTLIVWGDSLRAYGLAVCCIVILFAAFWIVINDSRPLFVIAATCTAVLSTQAIFTNALLVFACGMAAAIVAARRRQWKRALIPLAAGAVAASTLLPYAGVLRATNDWAEIRKFPLPVQVHLGVLREALLNGGAISFWFWVGLAVVAALLAVASQFQKPFAVSPNLRDARLYALIASLLACGTTILFFHRLQWPSNIWYYLPMLALVAMALDLILDFGSEFRAATVGRIVVAVACLLSSLTVAAGRVQVRASNLDIIASLLEKHAGAEDLIVVYPFVDGITFNRYFHGPAPWTTIPRIDDLSLHRWDQLMEQARRENAIAPILDRINETLRTGHQVWVATTFPLTAPMGPPSPVLPLQASQPQRIGYFLGGWRELLVADLREHTEHSAPVNIPIEQSVSKYERSRLFVFSGWKDSQSR
jgi:Dolichyl-phosphate-mannose-protein mannosyltransferase